MSSGPAADAEVVIVGGGPAGAACAYFLARAGVEVVVVDRARFPRDKPCAEYLSPQASRILSEMDVLEAVERSGAAQLDGMRVRAPSGDVVHGEFAANHGFRGFRDRGLALPRRVLDALLLDRARAAGARVLEGLRVHDLLRDGQGRVRGVSVAAVGRDAADDGHRVAHGAPGAPATLHAPLVIGADGLRTVVGRRLGLVATGRFPRRIAVVAHYEGVAEVGRFGEMHVEADGYCGIADVGGGVTNVAIVVPERLASCIAGRPAEFLHDWLARHPHLARRFPGARLRGRPSTTGPFNQRARRAYAPGVALVGDAADFFDPFTGEGIYAALRGGELLTGYAVDAARAPSARRQDIALAAWDRCLHAEFRGKRLVERAVGTAVAFPALLNRAASVLARRRDMADLLVGVAGDFVPPRRVLSARFLLPLVLPRWDDRVAPPHDDAPVRGRA